MSHRRRKRRRPLAPIVWIGRRTVDCSRHRWPARVWPVRVLTGAFASARPHRDLFLSPDHAIFFDGGLIPVRHLVNGSSIAQVEISHVAYFHVELMNHDILIAEGLPVESYLDTGDRSGFENGGGAIALHPDFSARIWEGQACAPLIVTGPELHAARRLLETRAAAAGREVGTQSSIASPLCDHPYGLSAEARSVAQWNGKPSRSSYAARAE